MHMLEHCLATVIHCSNGQIIDHLIDQFQNLQRLIELILE